MTTVERLIQSAEPRMRVSVWHTETRGVRLRRIVRLHWIIRLHRVIRRSLANQVPIECCE